MKKTGFTKVECLRKAESARRQLATMTELNSSQSERELTEAAIREWDNRALLAGNGVWTHDYEPIAEYQQ